MKRGRVYSRIGKALGLTGDVLGTATMQIEGNTQLVIENQLSIAEFSDTVLRVRTPGGGIRIRGNNLVIEGFGTNGLVLTGEFSSIEYLD